MTVTFHSLGKAAKFPSVQKFLKEYVHGIPDWETADLGKLKRYVAEGAFAYPAPDGVGMWKYSLADAEGDLARVGVALRWHAIQSALKAEAGFEELWQKSAAYQYWGIRANHRFDKFRLDEFKTGGRAQYLPMLNFRESVTCLARVFLLARECREHQPA